MNKSKIENEIKGFQKKIEESRIRSDDAFFAWFNNSKDKKTSFAKGLYDFNLHILKPLSPFLLNGHKEKNILEIGYGGGRLLAAASKYFKNAIGVDIHGEYDFVKTELNKMNIKNIRLLKTNGKKIPLKKGSVNIVYSFIVLQHVKSITIFNKYLEECYRVLRENGIAILYFGRYHKFSYNRNSIFFYYLDRVIEKILLKRGYMEIDSNINEVNLIVSLDYVIQLSKKIGFKVKRLLVSYRNQPNGDLSFGGQNGIVLKK